MNNLDLQPRLCLQRQMIDFHTLNTTSQFIKILSRHKGLVANFLDSYKPTQLIIIDKFF